MVGATGKPGHSPVSLGGSVSVSLIFQAEFVELFLVGQPLVSLMDGAAMSMWDSPLSR